MQILLVEDSLVNQQVIQAMLRKLGHQVTLASNGREAVAAVAAATPQLVLMDLRMPEMDGREAARHIRASGRADAQVPIIAMTADVYEEDVDKCRQAGMNGHIAKPIEPEVLFAE